MPTRAKSSATSTTKTGAKPKYAVGLDAGSAYIRCVICVEEHGRLRFLGFGEVESTGWQKGSIADPMMVSSCIQRAVQEAELQAQVAVDSLVAGVATSSMQGGHHTGFYTSEGGPRSITESEVTKAADDASQVRMPPDRTLLHVFPQNFTIDGRQYRNPRGVTTSRLQANVYMLTMSAREHNDLILAVHHAHFAVEETVFEPVAAAYACILPEDRQRGVALLDIGLHSSDLVVYEGDAIVHAVSLPICSEHFTRDVSLGLIVSFEDAERLKIQYGCAILGLTSDNSLIEVPSHDGRRLREAPRRMLNDVLEARAEELFLMVRHELRSIGIEGLFEGMVLTGGGARLNGMCDMAERVLNCPARNGLASGIQHWPEALDTPAWTTVAGLAMYSARLKMKTKREWKPKAPGLAGMIFAQKENRIERS